MERKSGGMSWLKREGMRGRDLTAPASDGLLSSLGGGRGGRGFLCSFVSLRERDASSAAEAAPPAAAAAAPASLVTMAELRGFEAGGATGAGGRSIGSSSIGSNSPSAGAGGASSSGVADIPVGAATGNRTQSVSIQHDPSRQPTIKFLEGRSKGSLHPFDPMSPDPDHANNRQTLRGSNNST